VIDFVGQHEERRMPKILSPAGSNNSALSAGSDAVIAAEGTTQMLTPS